jgi:hypothetical protein
MKAKKRIVIFDDEDGPRQAWGEKIRSVVAAGEFQVDVVGNGDFKAALQVLQSRRAAARKRLELSDEPTLFDTAGILFVDYDLFNLHETGEEVAYLARCFSKCGIIVAVNQFAREGYTFDLTLQGHPESFADLNLLAEQIFEPGLWSTPWGEFRPWFWPMLPKAVEAFERRVQEVEKNLDERILSFLEIPAEVVKILPLDVVEFITSEDATFRSFVRESGMALRSKKDEIISERGIARIAAARLSKWLERLVLPGQNILVDAAHLLERYPSLFLADAPEALVGWERSHDLLAPGAEIMDVAKLEPFRFKKEAWLSRTAWYWPQVSGCEKIKEVANPWEPRTRLAFCEDTSRFIHPDDAEEGEFVAKVESPFVRRFVSKRDPRYGPKLQFALWA